MFGRRTSLFLFFALTSFTCEAKIYGSQLHKPCQSECDWNVAKQYMYCYTDGVIWDYCSRFKGIGSYGLVCKDECALAVNGFGSTRSAANAYLCNTTTGTYDYCSPYDSTLTTPKGQYTSTGRVCQSDCISYYGYNYCYTQYASSGLYAKCSLIENQNVDSPFNNCTRTPCDWADSKIQTSCTDDKTYWYCGYSFDCGYDSGENGQAALQAKQSNQVTPYCTTKNEPAKVEYNFLLESEPKFMVTPGPLPSRIGVALVAHFSCNGNCTDLSHIKVTSSDGTAMVLDVQGSIPYKGKRYFNLQIREQTPTQVCKPLLAQVYVPTFEWVPTRYIRRALIDSISTNMRVVVTAARN